MSQENCKGQKDLELLQSNIGRVDIFVNDPAEAEYYTTTGGRQVSTLPYLAKLVDGEVQSAKSFAEAAETSAQSAHADAQSIKQTWASAETVLHTEEASATYNPGSGEMHFQIPAGEPGPPGEAPAIDVIDGGGAYQTWVGLIDGGTAIQNT